MEILGVVVFVARAKVKESLEMTSEAGRVGDVEAVAARVYVLVELVFIVRCGEKRAPFFLE